jgi:hypothetical protein
LFDDICVPDSRVVGDWSFVGSGVMSWGEWRSPIERQINRIPQVFFSAPCSSSCVKETALQLVNKFEIFPWRRKQSRFQEVCTWSLQATWQDPVTSSHRQSPCTRIYLHCSYIILVPKSIRALAIPQMLFQACQLCQHIAAVWHKIVEARSNIPPVYSDRLFRWTHTYWSLFLQHNWNTVGCHIGDWSLQLRYVRRSQRWHRVVGSVVTDLIFMDPCIVI